MSKIEVLIPVYLPSYDLIWTVETCLSSLRLFYPDVKVSICDDGSPIEPPEHWPIERANVVNLGYVATVNYLLRESTGDVLVVANDDLQFTAGSLDRYYDLPDDVIAYPRDTASGDVDKPGAIFGMTRKTFEKMGLLDERFRNFYADEEYAQRAERLGIELVCWKDIVLPHLESATFKSLGNKKELIEEDEARK